MASRPSISKERIVRAARIYNSNEDAGRALGIHGQSFARLCRRYGVLTPQQRRKQADALCECGSVKDPDADCCTDCLTLYTDMDEVRASKPVHVREIAPEYTASHSEKDCYKGHRYRGSGRIEVTRWDGSKLTSDRSLKVRNHSPTGFEWGYQGSGPAQLALALLLDVTDDVETATQYYQQFKDAVISQIPRNRDSWIISIEYILNFLSEPQSAEIATLVQDALGGTLPGRN